MLREKEVDPICMTFVETDIAPKARDRAEEAKRAPSEILKADLRESALLINSLGLLIGVGIPPF